MRFLLTLWLIFCVASCDSGGSGGGKSAEANTPISPLDLDLSGTWVEFWESKRFKADTDEYLFSSLGEYHFVLDDTAQGLRIDACREYGRLSSLYGVKTQQRVYFDIHEDGYTLQNDDSLIRSSRRESEWEPGFYFEEISTFRRLSREVEIDHGTFILRGPINIEQYAHVCVGKYYSNHGIGYTYSLSVPFGDEHITFTLDTIGEIAEGRYAYEGDWVTEAVRVDVYSNAKQFDEIVGSNTLYPRNVTVDITEFSKDRLSGTFSLTGQDDGLYSGEFEMHLNVGIPEASP